jgi:hypothetical protein
MIMTPWIFGLTVVAVVSFFLLTFSALNMSPTKERCIVLDVTSHMSGPSLWTVSVKAQVINDGLQTSGTIAVGRYLSEISKNDTVAWYSTPGLVLKCSVISYGYGSSSGVVKLNNSSARRDLFPVWALVVLILSILALVTSLFVLMIESFESEKKSKRNDYEMVQKEDSVVGSESVKTQLNDAILGHVIEIAQLVNQQNVLSIAPVNSYYPSAAGYKSPTSYSQ